MFDHYHRIPYPLKFPQDFDQPVVVPGMKANGWLVQNKKCADQRSTLKPRPDFILWASPPLKVKVKRSRVR